MWFRTLSRGMAGALAPNMENEPKVTVGQLLQLLRSFGDDANVYDYRLDELGHGTCEVKGNRGESPRYTGSLRLPVFANGPKGWIPASAWLYGGLGNTIATLKALPKAAECSIRVSYHADDIADQWLEQRGSRIQATSLVVYAKTGAFSIRLSNDLKVT